MRVSVFVMLLMAVELFAGTVGKTFEKTYDFDRGVVQVKSVNGSVDVESWDRDQVYVYADIEVKSGNRRKAEAFLEKVHIDVDQSSHIIKIVPDYPNSNSSFFKALFNGGKPSVRINFTIKIPKQAELIAKSVNGHVDVREIGGVTELSTTNGSIRASDMQNAVSANSTNGSIKVEIADWNTNEDISLRTVNGGIDLYLPGNINADVDISTVNGGVHTDYPLQVVGEIGRKNIKGTINDGGPNITVHTVNGGINLKQY